MLHQPLTKPIELEVAANFEFLLKNFDFAKAAKQEKQGFVLEGGSGSAKTWDIIQFLIYYCQVNIDKNKDILIFRNTFADLRKTVIKDFEKILRRYELFELDKYRKSTPVSYNLFGNMIYFTGLDGAGAHGERHDIIWGNEAMELNFDDFRQLNQRCNEAFFLDYNPYYTEHWIYSNILTRPDTKYFRSTQLMNPFLPSGQRKEILAYKPTPENIKNGTADDNLWKIYGLGLKGSVKGLIFNSVTWIDSFPKCQYEYGLDFGFTNDPTALVRIGKQGLNLYLELLCYEPIDNAFAISEMLTNLKIEKWLPITADSADKYNDSSMVMQLRDLGWKINKVNKGKGILWRIGMMKKYKIHIVRNTNAKREQENYKWREINGQHINEPIDKFNHFWDAAGYGLLGMEINNFTVKTNY